MKFNRKELSKALIAARKALPTRNSMPILNCVRIEQIEPGGARISATNLELTIHLRVALIGEDSKDVFVVPLKPLAGFIRSVKGEHIELSYTRKTSAKVTCGASVFAIAGHPSDDFPLLPKLIDNPRTVPSMPLYEALSAVLPAVSRDETRYNLNGVFAEFGDSSTTFTGTDGHRLVSRKIAQSVSTKCSPVIIPRGFVRTILPLLKKVNETSIGFTDRETHIFCGGVFVVGQNIEGDFPNYRNVISKTKKIPHVILDSGVWIDGLKSMLPGLDEETRAVKLTFEPDQVELTGSNSRLTLSAQIPQKLEGVSVTFNAEYLIDALSGFSEAVCMYVTTPKKPKSVLAPVVFENTQIDGCSLVMPVKIQAT